MGAFPRLAPFVREYNYEKQWGLRDIQEKAADAVLGGDDNLLIAAGTASGKTEAAFFPVLSVLDPEVSLGALYIGPLKALINDQFERLTGIFERGGIPLWRWHGDVDDNHKKKFLSCPSGVLQITPESLEALLLRHPGKVKALFGALRFVIIDEIHAFMGSDRGSQLLCQIARIEEGSGCRPRRIGLSATLGDYGQALRWLGLGSGRKGLLIQEGERKRRARLALDCRSPEEEASYYESLYAQCRGKKCVIFANSRLEAEETVNVLKSMAAKKREADVFYVHHGSVSGHFRMDAERELREEEGPRTAAATATLELGIDIGRLDRIIQIGPPSSVSGFVQRLGRSGRLSGLPEMYFTSLERPGNDESRSLPWGLLQTIAVVKLYLEEQWIEPALLKPLPYSLLIHQTLSVLASLGEQRSSVLARRLLSLSPFLGVSLDDYRAILSSLEVHDYIERTAEGGIILGLEGEYVVNNYSFYSVFPDEAEYKVRHGGKELGTVNFLPEPGSRIALGGRYWQIESFDKKRSEIYVTEAQSGGGPVWRGSGAGIHSRVAETMKRILLENRDYAFLSGPARLILSGARHRALKNRLASPGPLGPDDLLPTEDGGFCLLPWMGSRALRALTALLQHRDSQKELGLASFYRRGEFALYLQSSFDAENFWAALQRVLHRALHRLSEGAGDAFLEGSKIPYSDKYDYLLPQELLARQYQENMLAPEELREALGGC
ncbi:MAG: DEAD/DEAH box helicase [Spirochaetaceae bacterium]|jgi:ATP-dependent Lhr-like helicase|nr:DEAD/DEAH box helicase [Spirochaetaceae bacterium]